jgi:isopentenyl diphosphate isomerase/L-lactate dehydrogenase-like FMN-dependent dehydrogenase
MKPIGSISTSTTVFGQPLSMPIFISPAGVQALVCKEGEVASARAARKVGTIFGLSQHATRSIEQVAREMDNNTNFLWYQSYILKDRARTLRLVHRAVRSGYRGIFLTVDSVRFGYREADARNGWSALPPPHRLVNYDDIDDDNDDNNFVDDEKKNKNGKQSNCETTLGASIGIDTSKIYAGEEGEFVHNVMQIKILRWREKLLNFPLFMFRHDRFFLSHSFCFHH